MQKDKMKTKSDSLFRVIFRRVLVTLLPRTGYLAAISLMLVGVLLTCYSATANALGDGMQDASSEADVSPEENDSDPEYVEKRTEFLNQFFGTGPGGVSPSAYASALIAARALPLSPLLQGRKFISPETLEVVPPWTSPIPPPIQNSYGGNASARVHALAIDPINANVVYTGSVGGLAKTTDGGITWRYLSDAWASQSVSSIAINPNASHHVYVGTGADPRFGVGLYRSLDRGTTWSNLGATQFGGTIIRAIAIGARTRTGSIVYVANGLSHDSGLWRSSDSGVSWTRLRKAGQPGSTEEYNGIHDLAIDASTRPSALYVTDNNGAFKSTDSGQSWTLIHSVPASGKLNKLSVVNAALYLLCQGDAEHNLYKSTDRGATWIQIPEPCPCPTPSCDECVTCVDPGHIGFTVLAVDPANPQVILAGNQTLYRTENEGATWSSIGCWYGPYIHTDQRVIAFSPSAPSVVYEGNDGGIVKSVDAGQQWTNLNQNLPGTLLYGVALSAGGTMIAGTQDNGVVFSPVGARWDMIFGGDSAHNLIDPVNGMVGYFTMYRDYVFRRFNRATPHHSDNIRPSQFDDDSSCSFFPAFSMNPSSPTHIIAACQHVVRTLDGPTVTPGSWTTIGQPFTDPVTAASEAPNNSNVIYAVVAHRRVWMSTNANAGTAAVWSDVTRDLPGGIWAITVHPTDPQTAYLACDSGVYKTINMGTIWTQQGVPNLMYRDVAIDPANPKRIFAASSGGVFASTDGGSNWQSMSEGIPTGMMVTSLSFNAMSRQLAASTYGRGVYLLDLDEPPTVSISSSANLATTPGL
jgi:photosystem II stability/assembly factor-like uncharacterized protein